MHRGSNLLEASAIPSPTCWFLFWGNAITAGFLERARGGGSLPAPSESWHHLCSLFPWGGGQTGALSGGRQGHKARGWVLVMTGAIYQALPVSLAVYVLWVISWDPHKMCFPQTHSSAENTGVHRGVMVRLKPGWGSSCWPGVKPRPINLPFR